MVDIIRHFNYLQQVFADNVTKDISEQDLRDFLISVMPYTLPADQENSQVNTFEALQGFSISLADQQPRMVKMTLVFRTVDGDQDLTFRFVAADATVSWAFYREAGNSLVGAAFGNPADYDTEGRSIPAVSGAHLIYEIIAKISGVGGANPLTFEFKGNTLTGAMICAGTQWNVYRINDDSI